MSDETPQQALERARRLAVKVQEVFSLCDDVALGVFGGAYATVAGVRTDQTPRQAIAGLLAQLPTDEEWHAMQRAPIETRIRNARKLYAGFRIEFDLRRNQG